MPPASLSRKHDLQPCIYFVTCSSIVYLWSPLEATAALLEDQLSPGLPEVLWCDVNIIWKCVQSCHTFLLLQLYMVNDAIVPFNKRLLTPGMVWWTHSGWCLCPKDRHRRREDSQEQRRMCCPLDRWIKCWSRWHVCCWSEEQKMINYQSVEWLGVLLAKPADMKTSLNYCIRID